MTKSVEDAKSLCAALNRFGLPRAVANLDKDCLLACKASFQERTGLLDVVRPEESAFEHGRWVGADQQRARCERVFRDQAGPKLLTAAAELEAVRQQLEACQLDTGHLVRAHAALEAAFESLGGCLDPDE